MAKYRLLNKTELQELEKEFIDYLVLNGITADDWQKMQEVHPAEAERITDLFSDVVFEKILRKVNFLDKIEAHSIYCFQCLADNIVLVNLITTDTSLDFNKEIPHNLSIPSLRVYTQSKTYTQVRESEIFQMIESGCQISDGTLFKEISLLL